jgi:hypothetical protein
LWLAYPFVLWNGGQTQRLPRCALRRPVSEDGSCFIDDLPIMEMAAFGLTLLFAYPFGRFACRLFASSRRATAVRGLARNGADSNSHLALQAAATVGIGWALWHAATITPLSTGYLVYWVTWISWFAAGIRASWARPRRTDRITQ